MRTVWRYLKIMASYHRGAWLTAKGPTNYE
jgi:hypothetical protein